MTRPRLSHKRILAIDPYSRGFGFVVIEESGPKLVDWGLKETRADKEQVTLAKIAELIWLYRPSLLVVEDCSARGCRRRSRVRRLVEKIIRLAVEQKLGTRRVPISDVRQVFGADGLATKHRIATELAARFPELAPLLPPKRKPWMSQDARMAVFDAAALGIAKEK